MQDFYNNFIKNKAEMLLTDIHSVMYKTEAENVCEDF